MRSRDVHTHGGRILYPVVPLDAVTAIDHQQQASLIPLDTAIALFRINQQPAVRTTGDSAVPERHMGRSGSAPLLAFINVPGTRSLRLPPHNLVRLRAHPPRRHPRTRASSRPATIWKRPSPPLPLSTPAPPLEAPAAPSPDPLLGVQNGVAARTGPLGHL